MKCIALILVLLAASASVALAQSSLTPSRIEAELKSLQVNPPLERMQSPDQPEQKSVSTAVLYSLLLPGMGELYAGRYDVGKYFTAAEGALWIFLGSFDWYGNWLQNDARSFAVQHAGVTPGGKSEQYFTDIGNFSNVYDYNTQVLRDRDPQKLYDPTSGFYWNWDSPANMSTYRDRRVSSDQMFNNTRFVVAAIAVNHLVSALNAGRLTASHNRGDDGIGIIDLHADVIGGPLQPSGILLTVTRNF